MKKYILIVLALLIVQPVSANLIAHYKMNDNLATAVVVDSTGNHNGEYQINSVAQNTDTGNEIGKINGALDFVGGPAGEHVEIADHADFSPGSGGAGSGTPFSISAWVYMHDATTFIIANKGVYNTDGEWHFFTGGDDTLNIYIYDESVANCRIGRCYNTALTGYENQWIHLVMTYDGGILSSGIKLYLNGLRVDDTNAELNAASFVAVENDLAHAVWIGRYSTGYCANGLIDNVMFFNVALTADEVKRLYNNNNGTEIPAELDSVIRPRRNNTSPLATRSRYEF